MVVIYACKNCTKYSADAAHHAQAFVLHGAVDHLLKLIVKCQLSWGDEFICSLYKVTVKVSEEGR